jgi:hypothetical protein
MTFGSAQLLLRVGLVQGSVHTQGCIIEVPCTYLPTSQQSLQRVLASNVAWSCSAAGQPP